MYIDILNIIELVCNSLIDGERSFLVAGIVS